MAFTRQQAIGESKIAGIRPYPCVLAALLTDSNLISHIQHKVRTSWEARRNRVSHAVEDGHVEVSKACICLELLS